MLERKFADRPTWPRVNKKQFSTAYFDERDFKGWVSILSFEKVKSPLKVYTGGRELCILDDHYTWLEHIPENKNYSLTTMFNANLEIVQWYFDISKNNGVNEDGISYFDDLYLDIVVLKDLEMFLLDQDELDDALVKQSITHEEYDLANQAAKCLMEELNEHKDKLNEFCNSYLDKMRESQKGGCLGKPLDIIG